MPNPLLICTYYGDWEFRKKVVLHKNSCVMKLYIAFNFHIKLDWIDLFGCVWFGLDPTIQN